MPRYFFHVFDGKAFPDDEGTVLPDLEAVRAEAVKASGAMIRDHHDFWRGAIWTMEVKDEIGTTVCKMNFTAEL